MQAVAADNVQMVDSGWSFDFFRKSTIENLEHPIYATSGLGFWGLMCSFTLTARLLPCNFSITAISKRYLRHKMAFYLILAKPL